MGRPININGRSRAIGRDIKTITREEVEKCVQTDSFSQAARKLGCSYEMIRKLVRESHKDLYDQFVWNGLHKQHKGSGVSMQKRAYGNYKAPEDYTQEEIIAACSELSYNYAARKLNVTRERLERYLVNNLPEIHKKVLENGANMVYKNKRGKKNV